MSTEYQQAVDAALMDGIVKLYRDAVAQATDQAITKLRRGGLSDAEIVRRLGIPNIPTLEGAPA